MEDELIKLLTDAIKTQLTRAYRSREYADNYKGRFKPNPKRKVRKSNTGNLLRSVQGEWTEDFESGEARLDITMADYWFFVDQGRQKQGNVLASSTYRPTGRKSNPNSPFRRAIEKWIRERGVMADTNYSMNQKYFLVARSIYQKGIGGINFIERAKNSVQKKLEQGVEEYTRENIEELLDNIFPQGQSEAEFNL